MDRKNVITVGSIVILAALAVLVWNIPENGLPGPSLSGQIATEAWTNPWDDVDTDAATLKAQAWLDNDSGKKVFGDDKAAQAIPIFNENSEHMLWIIPVVNGEGLYTGFLQTDSVEFEWPSSYTEYEEPLDTFISRDSAIDMHSFFILKYGSDYAPEQITEPFVILKSDGGFFWMIEIIENGQAIEQYFNGIRLVE